MKMSWVYGYCGLHVFVMMLYMKFHENILNGFWVIERTRSCLNKSCQQTVRLELGWYWSVRVLFRTSLIWVCTVCLGLSVPILRIILVRGNVMAFDRISCVMVWSFIVMNLTLSGINYKFLSLWPWPWDHRHEWGVMMNKTLDLYLLLFQIWTKSILWFGKYELLKHFNIKCLSS